MRPSAIFLRVLQCLLSLCLCGAANAAQDQSNTGSIPELGLSFTVTQSWPLDLQQGYLPLEIALVYTGGEALDVEIDALNGAYSQGTRGIARRSIRMEPGSEVSLDVLVPNFLYGAGGRAAGIELRAGGLKGFSSLPTAGHNSGNQLFAVLVAGESAPPAGTNAALAAEVAAGIAAASAAGAGSSSHSSRAPEPRVGATTWSQLADRWQAYSSLNVVVLECSKALALDAKLEPLLAWVRLGGRLKLVGDLSSAQLAALSPLEGALDRPVGGQPGRFAHGFGEIEVLSAGFGWDGAGWAQGLWEDQAPAADEVPTGWMPNPRGWRFLGFDQDVRLVRLPLRGFLFALMLFAVLIGPVNLIVLARLRRPALLLLTIPILSLLATGAIVAYGVFHQGLDVKVHDTSLAFLDQQQGRVASHTLRTSFAGSSPSGGMRPGPGTGVFSLDHHRYDGNGYTTQRDASGLELMDDFVPIRRHAQQAILTEAVSHQGLAVKREGDGFVLTNGLSSAVLDLYYRSAEGRWFRAEGLEPGGEQTLGAAESFEDSDLSWALESAFPASVAVPMGGYVASLASDPFADDLGIEATDYGGEHFLIGRLGKGDSR